MPSNVNPPSPIPPPPPPPIDAGGGSGWGTPPQPKPTPTPIPAPGIGPSPITTPPIGEDPGKSYLGQPVNPYLAYGSDAWKKWAASVGLRTDLRMDQGNLSGFGPLEGGSNPLAWDHTYNSQFHPNQHPQPVPGWNPNGGGPMTNNYQPYGWSPAWTTGDPSGYQAPNNKFQRTVNNFQPPPSPIPPPPPHAPAAGLSDMLNALWSTQASGGAIPWTFGQ